jgi:methylenetetrahydrofolate reductase (NADPH)
VSTPLNRTNKMENDYIPPFKSKLVRRLLEGQFAITAEITSPVSGFADDVLARAKPLKNLVDAINVTGGPNSNVHLSSIASSSILQANDIEPVTQFTCRNRNRIALLNDLLGASALGIHNLLIRNEDNPTKEDQPEAMPVFDLKSFELIEIAYQMTTKGIIPSKSMKVTDQGISAHTKSLTTPTNFFIGITDTPRAEFSEKWVQDIKKKQRAGARFVQTQLCYDIKVIRSYAKLLIEEGLTEHMFFLIGNGPLLSVSSARWMRDNLLGVIIPDEVLDRMEQARDQKAEGIRICVEQIQTLSEIEGISGTHLMAPINTKSIPEVISQTNIQNR